MLIPIPIISFQTNPMSPSSSCRNGRTSSSCISRILRRILCFNALPFRSFDHEKAVTDEPGCTPSLMARLMGLETVPSFPAPSVGLAEDSPTTSAADSTRSRRIIPPYRELEDENFFILSFERRKPGRGSRRRRRRGGRGKENEEVNVVLGGKLEGDIRAENPGNLLLPLRNSGREPEKMEDELENSSPNSVLEFDGFGNDQESDSPGETSRLENSKTRRPLPLPLSLDSSGNSRERSSDDSCGNSRERKPINSGDDEKEKIGGGARIRDAEVWDEIGDLAATEAVKSSWLREEMAINRHCYDEIGGDLESSILDHLLEELLIDMEIF